MHGDSFGPTCLYSKANYTNPQGAYDPTVHPPLIGFSYDGYHIYGRHLSTSAVGYSTPLDDCGGHSHDALPYHYHPQIVIVTTGTGTGAPGIASGLKAPVTTVGPYKCWRGDMTKDAAFSTLGGQNNGAAFSPCTSMAAYYAAPGYTIPGLSGADATCKAAVPSNSTQTCASTGGSTGAAASAASAAAAGPQAAAVALALAAALAVALGGAAASR